MATKIGLEIHVQLKTNTKMFCECNTNFLDAKPNTLICPICTAQPGSKPMGINERALELALKTALLLGCKINTGKELFVERKHYFYPDLPANYQRTSRPFAVEGELYRVRIREVHFEEDPGRYELRTGEVDYNRSGIPLIEIVTEPDMKTPKEARDFLKKMKTVIEYLDAAKPEGGLFKVDANISTDGNERVEVKNINSIKGVLKALCFEEIRQKNLARQGTPIKKMETRHFEDTQMITTFLREKETGDDYRFLPDPDIPPLEISAESVEKLKQDLPETPTTKAKRLKEEYRIPKLEADTIASERDLADAFEKVAGKVNAKFASKWFVNHLKRELNFRTKTFIESKLSTKEITKLLTALEKRSITKHTGVDILRKMLDEQVSAKAILEEHGGKAGFDVDSIAKEVMLENKKAAEDYRAGKTESLNFLVGKVMAKTKGRLEPKQCIEAVKKGLEK